MTRTAHFGDREQIAEGRALVERALASRQFGPYTIQAAIAAVHSSAASAAATDWAQIVALYDVLMQATPSPVVELNRAVAVAMRDGPAAGLEAGRRHFVAGRFGRLSFGSFGTGRFLPTAGAGGRGSGVLQDCPQAGKAGAGTPVSRGPAGRVRLKNIFCGSVESAAARSTT